MRSLIGAEIYFSRSLSLRRAAKHSVNRQGGEYLCNFLFHLCKMRSKKSPSVTLVLFCILEIIAEVSSYNTVISDLVQILSTLKTL